MNLNKTIRGFIAGCWWMVAACGSNPQQPQQQTDASTQASSVTVPDFNADSAYTFVSTQVEFGPRVPNTAAHIACADYLTATLSRFTPQVIEQKSVVTAFDGTNLTMRNVIASFNPEKKGRILLFAHWDTRPWADQDDERSREPIDGADDGGSGVGVLLEVARQLSLKSPTIGVDIAFFDAEDWGEKGGSSEDSYALGTQYWTKNPHVAGYTANYGVLLDMVGSRNAQFRIEGFSGENASYVVEKIWKAAASLGYSNYFLFEQGGYVTDDHYYVIRYGIPSIDIINSDKTTRNGFASHWHTHNDNMTVIDAATLKAVGQTLLEVVYKEGN
jgi:Zn-dependent M28 family amino/carboxypeptidase